jgi:hypothetical protein
MQASHQTVHQIHSMLLMVGTYWSFSSMQLEGRAQYWGVKSRLRFVMNPQWIGSSYPAPQHFMAKSRSFSWMIQHRAGVQNRCSRILFILFDAPPIRTTRHGARVVNGYDSNALANRYHMPSGAQVRILPVSVFLVLRPPRGGGVFVALIGVGPGLTRNS